MAKRTLYVSRPLRNADELVGWAKGQGFGKTLTADDMHVTVAFSRAAVEWDELAADAAPITVIGGARAVNPLGDEGAIVLRFDSKPLADRWRALRDAGASWDYPSYQPHVTITYDGTAVGLDSVVPFDGALVFGAEEFAELDADDAEKSTFAAPASATSGLQSFDLEGAGGRRKRRRKRNAAGDPATKESPDMDALNLFIPITKIDAAKRLVYGVATAELPDVAKEICDYASTKPLYQKWSDGFSKATDGKSLGNLRAMHGNVAAGKLTEIAFNDDDKKIEICAKVVDDAEWAKVEEGVYSGFSQGGRYVKRWPDPADSKLTRYTAEPLEVSLVDNPCLPDATFSVIKADGSTELRKFKTAPPAAVEKGAETPGDAEVGEQVWVNARLPGKTFKKKAELRQALIDLDAEEAAKKTAAPVLDALAAAAQSLGKQTPEPAANADPAAQPAAGDKPVTLTITLDKDFAGLADALKLVKSDVDLRQLLIAQPIAVIEKLAADPAVAKRTYSADERKEYAANGIAMKDGSYPIPDKAALEDAISAFGRAKNKAATKRHIIKRAKALKATDLLPADWPGSTKDKTADKGAAGVDLNKGASLYSVSNLLSLLDSVEQAEDWAESPIMGFGASVALPKELTDRFGAVLIELGDIAAAILDVVLNSIKEEESAEALAASARILDLQKLGGIWMLAKAGAKHAKADKERIQQAHDLLVELDPDCCDAEDGEDDAEKLAKRFDAAQAANAKLLNETILPEIKKLADALAKVSADVKTVADVPLPVGTSSVTLRVVEKQNDVAGGARGSTETLEELADRALVEARSGKTAAAR